MQDRLRWQPETACEYNGPPVTSDSLTPESEIIMPHFKLILSCSLLQQDIQKIIGIGWFPGILKIKFQTKCGKLQSNTFSDISGRPCTEQPLFSAQAHTFAPARFR